ncbi:Na+/H+ antiporter subunit G [Ectothiorhodospiraceae bacterium BW-2]|nr:Na+/H+ antiporter subunit G [Ectothiorhodospiraceae bacterium BW-2]
MVFELIISLLVLLGSFFVLVGSIGLVKLPDFFTRLHSATKATTLGVGSLLIASTLYFIFYSSELSLHEVLIAMYLFVTTPISAHVMAKSALHLQHQRRERSQSATDEELSPSQSTQNRAAVAPRRG